jgi:hypothetical protein
MQDHGYDILLTDFTQTIWQRLPCLSMCDLSPRYSEMNFYAIDSISNEHLSCYLQVPLGLVQGRVTHMVWPPHKIGQVEKRLPEGRVMPLRLC